jgi:HK97 family phage major capsid protein
MSTEILSAIDAIGRNFEDFKRNNDDRLKEIEKKGSVDVLLEEKVNKLSEKLNQLELEKQKLEEEIQAKGRMQVQASAGEKSQHRKAFELFCRTGEISQLRGFEQKAMTVGTPSAGGYLVPDELDQTILNLMKPFSPLRRLCNVISVGGANYKKLVNTHGSSSGWVGETDARSATNTAVLAQVTPYMGEISANPAVSQMTLDDSVFNVEDFLAEETASEFGYQEGVALVTGNGTNKPKGVAGYTFASTDDGTRAFGEVQYVATGVSGDWAASAKADIFLSLIEKFKEGMLEADAAWIAKGTTLTSIRKLKDAQGLYLWNPSLAEGQKPTLFGFPVVQVDALAAIGANSYSIALANWKRAYTIVDRIGIRTLRDEYTNKPNVHFYSTKRVGGMIVDSEAVKFIKFGAS